jgi:NAD(P)H dehydrogenase (quinone)
MNIFIVYAHPEPKSFNGAMKDIAVETLQNAGHEVVVSDLYAMQFNAIVGVDDFKGVMRKKPACFGTQRPRHAIKRFSPMLRCHNSVIAQANGTLDFLG